MSGRCLHRPLERCSNKKPGSAGLPVALFKQRSADRKLQQLDRVVILHAAPHALGRVEQHVRLGGIRIAKHRDARTIDDEVSAVLMASFHGHLQENMSVAAALRAAQLEVLAQEQWHAPYYWAAFGLTGDYQGDLQR